MAELHVQIDRNTIEYEITASDGDCSHPKTYKASISPSTVGSFGEIRSKDYTLYTHGIIGYYEKNKNILIEKFSSTSESDLLIELIIHISNIKIDLIGTDNHEVYLTYTKDDCDRRRDIDVYFSKNDNEPFDIPILFKYGDKFFAPKDKNSYFIRWNEIKELEKYTQSNTNELNDYITGIYNILTEVDISQTSDYGIGFKDKPFFECNDKKFNTKRFSVSNESSNSDKTYKTLTHKHCGYDGIEHKPRIGNIHQFNGCKFDNKHITEVKNNNTINEVIVLYPKDDNNHKDPRLILLNEASLGYGSTTYGYYNLGERPVSCKGYTFKNFPSGCGFEDILGDNEPTYCTDVTKLRQLIRDIPQKPTNLQKPDTDNCKCSEPASEVRKTHIYSDDLNIQDEEESQELDDETTSDFSKKPVCSNHKVTFKKGEKPKDANQYINRYVKNHFDYTKVTYTPKFDGWNSSPSGPWNLYADTLFKLGKRTDNCSTSNQSQRYNRCEDIKFNVSEEILNSFFDHYFDWIDVYFLTKQHLVLLIEFFDGTLKHVIRTGRKDQGEWKKLDKALEYKNDGQLLKLLKQIESNLDTFFLLIDKYTTYKTTEIRKVIDKTDLALGVSSYQSTLISVKEEKLFKSKYKKCLHTINTSSDSDLSSSYPLRLFLSDGSEVVFYGNRSTKRKEPLQYTRGEGQNTMDVYLFKNNGGWTPVLISHKAKVYQPKIEEEKSANTNKWVHIPKGNKILSSVEKQENNILLKKKLCVLKKQVIENTKHLSAQKTTKQSQPPAIQPLHPKSPSQHGLELGQPKGLGYSQNQTLPQASSAGLAPELSSRGPVSSEPIQVGVPRPNGDSALGTQGVSVSHRTAQGPGTPQPTENRLEREQRVDETRSSSPQGEVQREEGSRADGLGGSGGLGAGAKGERGAPGHKGEGGPRGDSPTRTETTASSPTLESTTSSSTTVNSREVQQHTTGGDVDSGGNGGGANLGAKGPRGETAAMTDESDSGGTSENSEDPLQTILQAFKNPAVSGGTGGGVGVGVMATVGAVVYKK